ncbi:MAG TPA: hypothetical protein VFB12_28410 [Ktedonobacteraceae bacterium]|nr:hypothetical protein [Ktedonobacteraceae bacterium]
MEEKQILDFVHRVSHDETLCKEVINNPDHVIMRENFSPRVAQIITRLIPHLAANQLEPLTPSLKFWF